MFTNQTAIEQSATAVYRQGRKATRADGSCVYLASNGDRCGIGHLLSHNTASRLQDSYSSISQLIDSNLTVRKELAGADAGVLFDLQIAHDSAADEHFLTSYARYVRALFRCADLTFLDQLEKENG